MRRLVALVVCLASCGGSGGDIPVSSLGGAVANAYCNILVRCGVIDDSTTCHMLYLGFNIDADLLAAVNAGKVIYHPDLARECLDSLSSASCDGSSVFSGGGDNAQACRDTFEGTVHAGGACALGEECISGDCQLPSCPANMCCQGMCIGDVAPTQVPIGGTCMASADCSAGYCNFTTMTCDAYLPAGAPCTQSSACGPGAQCNTTCQTLALPGAPCTAMIGCRDIGDTCSPTSMTCVAVGLTGDACQTANDCSFILRCDATQHCALGARTGEACNDQTGNRCIDNSYCEITTQTCTARKPDGQACMGDQECVSDTCDTTTTQCLTPPVCI